MIDLTRFAAGEDDIRYYMHRPFSIGGYTYATNGHILIRIDGEHAEPPEKDIGAQKLLDKTFALEPAFSPLTIELPPAEQCGVCDGTGIETDMDDSEVGPCEYCDGSKEHPYQSVMVGDTSFARRYLKLIIGLPSIEFATNGTFGVAAFRFDGGIGVLMPMRPR